MSAIADADEASASLDRHALDEQSEQLLLDPEPEWILNYGAMAALAALIAGLGMRLDSPPIVIGAMLVAPVMKPVLGLGIACLTKVPAAAVRRLLIVLALTSIGLVGIGWLLSVLIPSTEVSLAGEVLSRTAPDVRDLIVALAAGAVGAFAILRPRVAETISGVAIAVALVPPPVAAGIALGEGFPNQAVGALLLYGTNLVAIVLGTVLTSLLLRLLGERPFVLDTKRLISAGATALVLTVGIGWLLFEPFADAVDTAQSDRNEAARAADQNRQQNLARTEIEAWLADSEQPELGVVSIDVPVGDDEVEHVLVSAVLLGDTDAYVPPLDDLEFRISDALSQPVRLKFRLVGVADQVSSSFEIEPNPEADADALLRAAMEEALVDWTRGFGGVRIIDVTTSEPGMLLVRIASAGDLPPLQDLNQLLGERLDAPPPYELVVEELIIGIPPIQVQATTDAVRVSLDGRQITGIDVCSTGDAEMELEISRGQLVIEVQPDSVSISNGDVVLTSNRLSTDVDGAIETVTAAFDRQESGIDALEITLAGGTPAAC